VRFDRVRLEVRGTPTRLLEDVAANPANGGAQFDVSGAASGSGTLVYLTGKAAAQTWQVAWLESSGKMQPIITAPGAYAFPRFSPEGRKLVFVHGTDIYVHDLERDTGTRLTFTGSSSAPVWTPDGKHIAFYSGGNSISWIRSDGAGEPQRLLESQNVVFPGSFSPDGRRLAYLESSPETRFDIWTLPLDITDPDRPKPGKPEPFLRTPADETVPRFSPDGRWIVYHSNETGNNEIYVQAFPAGGGKWQISTGGGFYAMWSNNGRELFYEAADTRIMVVDYAVEGASFVVRGKPRLWSDKPLFYNGTSNLDLAPDGKRFAVFLQPEAAPAEHGPVHVTMLQNFFDELRRRIP
jgi:serine/threonine-protein kinase